MSLDKKYVSLPFWVNGKHFYVKTQGTPRQPALLSLKLSKITFMLAVLAQAMFLLATLGWANSMLVT